MFSPFKVSEYPQKMKILKTTFIAGSRFFYSIKMNEKFTEKRLLKKKSIKIRFSLT